MTITIPQRLLDLACGRSGHTALRHKENGAYQDVSWGRLNEEVRRYGRALMSAGIKRGDCVAIMAPNGPAWVFADLGVMAVGALSVPIYHTEGISTLLHIVGDSGARLLFLHSPLIAAEVLRRRHEIPTLERMVLLQGDLDASPVLSLSNFLLRASEIPPERFEEALHAGRGEETATVVYTSGTTGPPKGVCLTHDNILSNIEACASRFTLGPGDECLSFLPLSHVFERVDGYYFMLHQGVVISYAENIDSVPVNMQEIRPTVMISVPRLYEKMYARVMERILGGPQLKKQLFFAALKAGKALARKELAGEKAGLPLQIAVNLARSAVFSKLQERLGGRLRFFISGGAPLGRSIAEFFQAAAIPIYEGYGLTESAGGIAVNAPGAQRLGTVGRPFPNTEVRICADGEILLRGSGIFPGYWNRPEETSAALVNGWFHTGDVGMLDSDGFLSITDRKKDIIVTASGENIAPQPLENLFKRDKFIANVMVFGDRKPYLTALFIPNLENLEKFAHESGIVFLNHCDLVNHPKILELIRLRIDRLQEELPAFQRIKRFTLLSQDFSPKELTPTLKVKRKVVAEHFRNVLEGMYLAQDHGIHDSGFCVVEKLTEAEKG